MLKNLILIPVIIIFGFINPDNTTIESSKKEISKESQEEILMFNQIIQIKLEQAAALDEKATILFAHNPDSKEGNELKSEATLYRAMTLKYQAAIACRML
ncbi:MAG: putative MPP superfamily phosphohydrolase [Dokdonia sp.]|jgi:predicted MPP superfamily phosphohydrolase